GMFGPMGMTFETRERVFTFMNDEDTTYAPAAFDIHPTDWAFRYLSWMALGGTRAKISSTVVNLVANVRVLGHVRGNIPTGIGANMLEVVTRLCGEALPASFVYPASDPATWVSHPTTSQIRRNFVFEEGTITHFGEDNVDDYNSSLFDDIGDAEFWEQLCSFR